MARSPQSSISTSDAADALRGSLIIVLEKRRKGGKKEERSIFFLINNRPQFFFVSSKTRDKLLGAAERQEKKEKKEGKEGERLEIGANISIETRDVKKNFACGAFETLI